MGKLFTIQNTNLKFWNSIKKYHVKEWKCKWKREAKEKVKERYSQTISIERDWWSNQSNQIEHNRTVEIWLSNAIKSRSNIPQFLGSIEIRLRSIAFNLSLLISPSESITIASCVRPCVCPANIFWVEIMAWAFY